MKKLVSNQYIALLIATMFLVSIMLPYVAVHTISGAIAAQPEQPSSSELSLLDEKILICTTDGFKWVSLKDVLGGKEQPQSHTHYECALCYSSVNHLGDFILTKDDTPTHNPISQPVFHPILQQIVAQNNSFHHLQPRAPPHLT